MKKNYFSSNKPGSVSMFAVIFFILLSFVLLAGFFRVTNQDLSQTFNRNLSQSAYDSALTGVEDAKRILTKYYSDCSETDSGASCTTLRSAIDLPINNPSANSCNKAPSLLNDRTANTDEVLIKKDENSDYNQAYTCVKIERNTEDYLGTLVSDSSKMIPLIGVSAFNKVRLEWFSAKDLGSLTISRPTYPNLLSTDSYKNEYPPVLIARLIQSPSSFKSDDLENRFRNYSKLTFYPSTKTVGSPDFSTTNQYLANEVKCQSLDGTVEYSCSVDIKIPDISREIALLQLKSVYSNTDFRVILLNDSTTVNFKQVQTKVDSTGRAGDIYRRVETRLETVFNEAYPDSAVEVSGNFCKDFGLTVLEASPFTNECRPWEP